MNPCFPKYRKETVQNLKNLHLYLDKMQSDPKIKAFGYQDMSTFKWMWKKYVGKEFDPERISISETDIGLFKAGAKEFRDGLGKESNWFSKWFKLPKALTRKIPEAEHFGEEMSNATSFRQKYLRETSADINIMTDGLMKMVTSGDYHQGVPWSKTELTRYQNLERELELAKTPEQRLTAMNRIVEMVGVRDADNNPIGGQILWRFNDLITFNTDPRNANETAIVDAWSKVRKTSARSLLNGIEQSKAIINNVKNKDTRADLQAIMDRLQSAVDRIHFTQKQDEVRLVDSKGLFNLKEADMNVYNAETNKVQPYKVLDAEGNMTVPAELTKYAPQYVMELANVVRQVTDYASNPKDSKWESMTSEQIRTEIEQKIDLGSMINRLKARTDIEHGQFYSIDPMFSLLKYTNDVAHFNYATRINLAYQKAAYKLSDIAKKGGMAKDLGKYAANMLDTVTDIRDSALNNYTGDIREMDSMVRWINSWEYISKLGWSLRGGLRNRSQMLFDWVKFGTKGFTKSKRFYEERREHQTLAFEQLERFGILFGETEQKTAAGLAIATAGSIEEVAPKGTVMTSESGLKRTAEPVTTKFIEATAKVAEVSAGPLRWAENANRVGTFKRAFAMSMMEMNRSKDFYTAEWKKAHNTDKPPSNEVLEAYMAHQAGNYAAKVTRDLHFEYDKWAKAKALQTQPGKVVGQFQTYRFALWDLQWQLLKKAGRGVSAGKFGLFETDAGGKITRIMPEIQEAMRYVSLYSLIVPAISAVTNLDVGNLIQNETYDTAERFYKYFTADEDDPEALEDKYGQFFGKGALAGNLGPFASDLLTMADLLDFYNSTPDELQETMKMKYDPSDPDWWYKVARVINIQSARTGWHTVPALLKSQYERIGRVETGLYKPKHLFSWINKSDDPFFKQRKNWLENSPYSPVNLLYTGKVLPKVSLSKEKKRPKRKSEALEVLEGMLAGRSY